MSTQARYSWENGPAPIKQHSIAKHKVLQAYLSAYFRTLIPEGRPRDEFKLTLVDGFAGGGLYSHEDTKELIKGSPFIFLDAEKEADFLINQNRTKQVKLDITHFFIEPNRTTCAFLKDQLIKAGYANRLGKNIHLVKGRFQDKVNDVINFIKQKSPKSGRSIFLLDQFGYVEITMSLVRKILSSLPSAEVILTFAVDSIFTFADQKNFENALSRAEIPDFLQGRPLQEIKDNKAYWRLYIQSGLYRSLIQACQASYYTPFFIRNKGGHGDYWLIHLSQHHRARDVMAAVHWQNQNHFIHYGGAGLNMFRMLGYDPTRDSQFTGQGQLGFEFDDVARKASIKALMQDIPKMIYAHEEGLSYEALFSNTCNGTPAFSSIYREALGQLCLEKEIEIIGADGAIRRSGNNIKLTDRILAPLQRPLFPRD